LVLRKMEDFLVTLLLQMQPMEWYQKKIKKFAHRGTVTESEFYQIIQYPYPGENNIEFGDPSLLDVKFGLDVIEQEPESIQILRQNKEGKLQQTAAELLETATVHFKSLLKECLHPRRTLDKI